MAPNHPSLAVKVALLLVQLLSFPGPAYNGKTYLYGLFSIVSVWGVQLLGAGDNCGCAPDLWDCVGDDHTMPLTTLQRCRFWSLSCCCAKETSESKGQQWPEGDERDVEKFRC